MDSTLRKSREGKTSRGFTLLEVIVTISIVGILAAVVTPTYLETQNEAKLIMSETNISNIKQAFVNLYLQGFIERKGDVWPDEPTDNKMTYDWANSTTVYDGRTVSQLFNGSKIIYNPYDHPYLYTILPATAHEQSGIQIEDPDTGVLQTFRP